MLKLLPALAFLAVATLLLACGGYNNSAATATPGGPVATATLPASANTPPAPDVPAAPSNLLITGTLPDLHTPVPLGEGEQGRISVSWQDNSSNETGFRLLSDCNGTVSTITELAANETSIAPIQTCRPGRLGVAAFNAGGVSEIVWSP